MGRDPASGPKGSSWKPAMISETKEPSRQGWLSLCPGWQQSEGTLSKMGASSKWHPSLSQTLTLQKGKPPGRAHTPATRTEASAPDNA